MVKLDIHDYDKNFNNKLKAFQDNESIDKRNRDLVSDFLNDCALGKTIKHKAKKRIGSARRLRYLECLTDIIIWFNKPLDEVTQKDMERIVLNLENNKYTRKDKKYKGENYSSSTLYEYKKTIKKFYKWLLGNNDHYPDLVSWIENITVNTEIPALSRNEVEKLASRSSTQLHKTLILFLFDAGTRIEETLNVKKSNLTRVVDKDKENPMAYYKIRIEYSKTKPRTIGVPMCTEVIDQWLEYSKPNDNDYLFPISYDAVRMFISRLGKEVLNKRVTAHILRHSSCTYYCTKLNHFQLCYRYGWSMKSNSPDRYIDREGLTDDEAPKQFKSDEIEKLRDENKTMKEEMKLMKELINNTRNEIVEGYWRKKFKKT